MIFFLRNKKVEIFFVHKLVFEIKCKVTGKDVKSSSVRLKGQNEEIIFHCHIMATGH